MAQLSYGFLMDIASEGLLADCGFKNVLSPRAFEDIIVGRGVVKVIGEDLGVRLPGQNYATIVFDADLITDNIIQTTLNTAVVGIQKSVINFNIDFVALNSIVATVNGGALAAVLFSVDQATTIALVAAKIQSDASVSTATVTGVKQITVTFLAAGANVVTSVVTSAGATQPTATIGTGSVLFLSSHLITMNLMATELALEPNIASVTVGGAGNRTLFINADFAGPAVVNAVTVSLGASQAGDTEATGTQDTLYGVALRVQNKENLLSSTGSNGAAPYIKGEAVSLLTKGRVYVKVENALTSDDPVYLRFVTNGATKLVGQFRSDADSGKAVLVSNARWIIGAAADGLAVLEINMP